MGVGVGGGVTVFYLKFVFGTVIKDMHVVRFYLPGNEQSEEKRYDALYTHALPTGKKVWIISVLLWTKWKFSAPTTPLYPSVIYTGYTGKQVL